MRTQNNQKSIIGIFEIRQYKCKMCYRVTCYFIYFFSVLIENRRKRDTWKKKNVLLVSESKAPESPSFHVAQYIIHIFSYILNRIENDIKIKNKTETGNEKKKRNEKEERKNVYICTYVTYYSMNSKITANVIESGKSEKYVIHIHVKALLYNFLWEQATSKYSFVRYSMQQIKLAQCQMKMVSICSKMNVCYITAQYFAISWNGNHVIT